MFFLRAIVLSLLISWSASSASAMKYAVTVMDGLTGEILFAEDDGKRLHPAGLTKLMTLYVAFEAIENGEIGLDDRVEISNHAAWEAPAKLGLRQGQEIRLRYLLRAVGVQGANDASTAIAEYLEGSEAAFARRMNRTAQRLGMDRSTFRNAHGLTESGHLTTTNDMAILFRALHDEFPDYFNLFKRKTTSAGVRTIKSSARRLLNSDETIIGAKTGYTRASGYSAAVYNSQLGKSVIIVMFGGRSTTTMISQINKLRDLGFRKVSFEKLE